MPDERSLYLDLIKRVLTNVIYEDPSHGPATPDSSYDHERRAVGKDWPLAAHTMVGLKRLDNLQSCLESVLADQVPGDFIETGVWRGGACIFARAVFAAHGVTDRTVWVADSFEGMPTLTEGHPYDVVMEAHRLNPWLAVSQETVRQNFERYRLLDDQVRFLPGWFDRSLPSAPIRRLAVLRLDGDLYGSTMDALTHLYPKLSPGGFVIVDDYVVPACREAVTEFRATHGITDPIVDIDGTGVFWRHTGTTRRQQVERGGASVGEPHESGRRSSGHTREESTAW